MNAQNIFETARLVARPWVVDDAQAAFQLYSDPEVVRYIGGQLVDNVQTQREKLERLHRAYPALDYKHGDWALVVRATGQVIGAAILKPTPDVDRVPTDDIEIGWHLARAHWGHGYATEAGRGLMQYGFDTLGYDVLHAVIEPPNMRSIAVVDRLGMRYVERTTRYFGVDLEHYVFTQEEYQAARAVRSSHLSQ